MKNNNNKMKINITKTSTGSPKQVLLLEVFDFWFYKIITESFYKFSSNIIEVIRTVLNFLFVFMIRFQKHKKHKSAYSEQK